MSRLLASGVVFALAATSVVFHLYLIFSGLLPNLVTRPLHLALALPWVFVIGAWSIFLKLCIICAFCSLFANLFGSAVFASLMTVFVYFAAEYASYPLAMMRRSATVVPENVSRLIYHLLPNFDKIDLKYAAIHGENVASMLLVEISLYAFLYMAVVFIPSWRFFARHEH